MGKKTIHILKAATVTQVQAWNLPACTVYPSSSDLHILCYGASDILPNSVRRIILDSQKIFRGPGKVLMTKRNNNKGIQASPASPEVIAFFSVNWGLNFRALLTMVDCSTFHFQADNKQFRQKLLLLRTFSPAHLLLQTFFLLHIQSLGLASRSSSPIINQPEIMLEKVF